MQVTKKRNKKLTYALLIAAIIAVMGLVGVSVAGAKGGRGAKGGGACHGTYYVDVQTPWGPSKALWTFNQDGTFQGTDSSEPQVPFSHQQGAWQHTIAREAKATWLDFSYRNQGDPTQLTDIARVDAELEFGDRCQTLTGDFALRFYDYGQNEDPLDPAAGTPAFDNGSFTAERLNP